MKRPYDTTADALPCGRCFDHCRALGAGCPCPCHQTPARAGDPPRPIDPWLVTTSESEP